jgi:hypothetical protein
MRYGAELADPIADIRDVVETFRVYRVITADWYEVLTVAVEALDRLPEDVKAASRLPVLIPRIRQLLQSSLKSDDPVLQEVADHIADLLQEIRIPGIPRPDDDHWEFD